MLQLTELGITVYCKGSSSLHRHVEYLGVLLQVCWLQATLSDRRRSATAVVAMVTALAVMQFVAAVHPVLPLDYHWTLSGALGSESCPHSQVGKA